MTEPTEARVREILAQVPDPEIPSLSVLDLGIVHRIDASPERVRVELLPTFVGCPAIDVMRREVAERLAGLAPVVEVEVSFAQPWTSDRITAEGRRKLRESGFAPPQPTRGRPLLTLARAATARCPHCGSGETTLESPFGPTPCRAIFYCNACRQPFEQFKVV